MLLNDTTKCPSCNYVLKQNPDDRPEAERPRYTAEGEEDPCPKCGEMVRRGLVRCWKCSTFMQPEIATVYKEMKAQPQPVIYSPLPEGEAPEPNDFETSPTYRAQTELHSLPDAESAGTAAQSQDAAASQTDASPSEAQPAETPESDAAHSNGDAPMPDVPHSVATGGDALFQVALAEESESKKGRRRASAGLIVYCPNGHRIEVEERHRGRTGRCPKCKSPFFVPLPELSDESTQTEEAATSGYGKFQAWITDLHLHVVTPDNLKLKPGSLKADFQLFDVAVADDEILLAALTKKKGSAGATAKKRLEDREAVQAFLRGGGPIADLPAAQHFTLAEDKAKSLSVALPAAVPHESMFAGIPVFGEGMIAVYLPEGDPINRRFLSFTLSQFREFEKAVREQLGLEGLADGLDVPLSDQFTEGKCHYSEETFQFLEKLEYHEADPEIKLQLVGRKCAACGLIISEESRKKEKIGGANGKGIAKAKCPKCQQKFGSISLFAVEQPPEPETEEAPQEADAVAT